ncbi:MAG: aminotransferase class III-fold pyridoxal phosphate-dependent enzyme [Acidobacteriota bacterium]
MRKNSARGKASAATRSSTSARRSTGDVATALADHQHRPRQDGLLPGGLAAYRQSEGPLAADGRPFVEEAIEREAHALSQIAAAFAGRGDDIAAIIVEPIQGEGGDNHFRPELFQALRKIADEREALLIFDEVQTGLGITGTMWAYEHFVEPDMIAFGKKMQVCGFFASRRLDEVPDNVFACKSRINSTWGGDLTDMVRATRILEVMAEESLCANAEAMGKRLLDGFQKLCQEFPEICENPRGRGLMCAFDVKDRAIRTALLALTFEKGMLVLPTGELGIRARPSLVVKAEEIDLALSIFRDSLIALRGSLGPISAT